MKIPIETITNRLDEVNRKLDLYYADLCSRAPERFTRSYILQSRSLTAKASFDRLIQTGVIVLCGTQRYFMNKTVDAYRFDWPTYQRFKDGHLLNAEESRTTS